MAAQLKLNGYRAIAFKSGGKIHLRSRNNKDFARRYPAVVKALARLPDETVIDGEVVALDEQGRPSFSRLQNYGSAAGPVVFFVFDVMVLARRDVMAEPLSAGHALLEKKILPNLTEPVRYSAPLEAPLPDLIAAVKAHGLEDLVSKRCDSRACARAPGRKCASTPDRSSSSANTPSAPAASMRSSSAITRRAG